MTALNMFHRCSSPSARFYAHSSTPNTPQMQQPLQSTDGNEGTRVHVIEPFGQFQGFPDPTTGLGLAHPGFGACDYDTPEGTSPRTPVPWEAVRSRVQAFVESDGEDNGQPRIYDSCCDVGPTSNSDVTPEQFEALTQQQRPPFHNNFGVELPQPSPCLCMNSAEPLRHLQGCYHGGNSAPPMPSSLSRHPNTFRVPSDSEPSYLGARLDSLPMGASLDDWEAGEVAASIPSSILGGGASTIYPEDSVSATSRAGAAPSTDTPRSLVDFVLEIHDICLAATQRHLESLRVNWDLRHGRLHVRAVGESDEASLRARQLRDHDRGRRDRWTPYSEAGPRRRVRSESHLEHMVIGQNGDRHQDGGHDLPDLAQKNPIPEFTNSLLHNIGHICDLIWRRAQRDREDVLGAEVKACQEMSFLYECGETIMLYNAVDAERDPPACWRRLTTAGIGICEALGDLEGMRLMGVEQLEQDG